MNDATDPTKNYTSNSSTANKPTDGWYFVRVLNHSGNMVTQLASLMNATLTELWIRSSTNTGTFGSWKKII